MTQQAEHAAARPLPPPARDVLTEQHLFTIEDGPGPDLLDSDAAYLLAQTAGGTAARARHGTRLEAAVLATNFPGLPPLANCPAPTNLAVPTPLWAFRYGDEVDPDRLILILDARSGGVVWTNASEPGH
jgi:hypothetical protein